MYRTREAWLAAHICDEWSTERCEDCGERIPATCLTYFMPDGNECDDGTYIGDCCVDKWMPGNLRASGSATAPRAED